MAIRYGGLRERVLTSAKPGRLRFQARTTTEDEVSTQSIFRLGDFEASLLRIVKELCEPLFVVFTFATFHDEVYEPIITNFLNGRIS